jgi:hypothetical protein
MFSEDTHKAWDSLLAHIELVGSFEFAKEVFAILGLIWALLIVVKIFFSLLTWSKPKHPHQIQGRL